MKGTPVFCQMQPKLERHPQNYLTRIAKSGLCRLGGSSPDSHLSFFIVTLIIILNFISAPIFLVLLLDATFTMYFASLPKHSLQLLFHGCWMFIHSNCNK